MQLRVRGQLSAQRQPRKVARYGEKPPIKPLLGKKSLAAHNCGITKIVLNIVADSDFGIFYCETTFFSEIFIYIQKNFDLHLHPYEI